MSYDGPRFSLPTLGPAIKLLMLVNGAVFLANMLLMGRLSDPSAGSGGFWFAFSWSALADGYGTGLLRVLTYQFTHSFRDPMHLLMNLLVLWFFGPLAEARLGFHGALRLYLWGGLVGALAHLGVASLQGHASVPLIGASGACYAFLLYAACATPQATVLLVILPVPMWGLAALLVGLGVYHTFVEFATGYAGGVSHGAHLGGALLGGLAYRLGWFVEVRADGGFGVQRFLATWRMRVRARRAERHAAIRLHHNEQLDAILAKVKAEGIGALSPDERRFLERSSQRARSDRG
jgi:membrane associated rhomboid family serine protease